ncbi:hypothetical protein POX_a01706 [Penicillium oxalicum]|uniref:hypothetical protein n=1 Tax=Penicillium oxalicum TaxID=69781 RepID=UPI0020B729E2|nr:hypothetical protein POX_a01706 [Penicillium oxalicum]KAI2795102.1 hypothetical protein POX_a01706 [Penicillium oxalicum]
MSPSSMVTSPPPVEARSLSSITAIAANPPAYPRNPTHEKHDPLELYIVRVPGSQDIFLSPVKPPTKSSVSAEAINASLYYLHVATPEDDALLEEVELEREKQRSHGQEGSGDTAQRDFARLNKPGKRAEWWWCCGAAAAKALLLPAQEKVGLQPVPRRPVPGSQASAEKVPLVSVPQITTTMTVPELVKGEPRDGSVDSVNNTIPRRPLPSLPASETPVPQEISINDEQSRKGNRWSTFANHVQNAPSRSKEVWREKVETMAAGRYSLDASRPQLLPRWSHNSSRSPNRSPEQSPSRQPRPVHVHHSDAGFRLTLIRRDPTSGTQWNVATISTPRIDRNAVDIEISTPGYNRFAGSRETLSLADLAANLPPGMFQSPGSSIPAAIKNASSSGHPPPGGQSQPSGSGKFRRQLCVSRQFGDPHGGPRGVMDTSTGHLPEGSKLKSGYYVFNSPWNGICTFSSSVNGRSLKCKHMIPTPGHVSQGGGGGDGNQAVTVAEIRFNMPFQAASLHYQASRSQHAQQGNQPHPHTGAPHASPSALSPRHFPRLSSSESNPNSKRNSISQLLTTGKLTRPRAQSGSGLYSQSSSPTDHPRASSSHGQPTRRTSFRSAFSRQSEFRHQYPPSPNQNQNQHQHHLRSGSTSSGGPDSDEDRLDFSLARELAGGGIRGKSAKLGKLVIEDEGLKMLDLVVAACMAVWWRGYYY